MPHLDIQLLGDFRLTLDGRILSEINTTRLQSLLVYLLLFGQTPQPRRHIAFLFWPDTTEKQALSNLRTTYTRLRQKLPEAALFLQANRQTMQWQPDAPFTLDVAEFETAVNTAGIVEEWQLAVDLYHGPLLPGWYEEWLEPERERLQQLFFQAGESLLHLQEEQRYYPAAIKTAQQLLRHDPLHEPAYRDLMRLQALGGGKADALRTYHTCATLLEQELGVTPDQKTQELYEQLLQAGIEVTLAPTSEPETAVTPLVGRDEEWNQLKQAWQKAGRGRSRLALISGEAGTGKSRLADELLQWAQRQGIDALSARSYEAEGELAYAPVLTWLRSPVLQAAWNKLDDLTLTELARLLPELLVTKLDLPAPPPLTQSWQRQHLFQALAKGVLARNRPLLLHIDDLQWCDRETLEWLHFLLRFEPQPPLLVVGTYRPEEIRAGHPLTALQLALRQSRQLKQLELQPLGEADTAALAGQYAGQALGSAAAGRLYRETEGNPLFVIEMMRSGWLNEWLVKLPEQQPERQPENQSEFQTLPPTIQAMIQARFLRVSPQARELIDQAAVIGRAFDYNLLAQSSGMSEDILVTRLDELWRRRIIREHGGTEYDFSHDKFREVAYAELSQVRRRLLHRRVAQTLELQHASHPEAYSGQIAAHYERAGMSLEAIPYYQRAAEAAKELYATDEAKVYIRRALRLLSSLTDKALASWRLETKARLYETLGDLLHFAAHYEEAQNAYERALMELVLMANGATSEQESIWQCRLQRKTGSACLPQHHYKVALQYFERAQAALGPEPATAEIAWWREWIDLQQERKYVYYWLNRWPEIAAIFEESRPILAQYGTPVQRALFFDPSMFYRRDRFAVSDEVLGFAREWQAANLELDDPVRQAAAHFSLGFALLWHGDLTEAEAEMRTALESTKKTGDLNLRARCLTYLTIVYRKQEKVEEVRALSTQSAAAAAEVAMPEYVATAKANLSWLAWRDGHYQQAQMNGRAALELWLALPAGHASGAFQWTALFPLMAIEVANGNLAEAIAHVNAVLDRNQQKLPQELTAVMQKALVAHRQEQPTHTDQLLTKTITIARQMHYL